MNMTKKNKRKDRKNRRKSKFSKMASEILGFIANELGDSTVSGDKILVGWDRGKYAAVLRLEKIWMLDKCDTIRP